VREPLAITRPIANKGSKIVACCSRAFDLGVRPGMLHAEALATVPTLTCVEEDLDADRQTLTQLAQWSQRFSPIVGLEEGLTPSSLYVDVTGCASCFGGEDKLLQQARAAFRANGWRVVIALADTIGAAWALSHFAPRLSPLASLPIAALRLSDGTVATLHQLGIERIAQLLALPRDQVADRFGNEVRLRLDQALGFAPEVIVPFHDQPAAAASWVFEHPVEQRDAVAQVLDILLERLQANLEKRCCGARLVECTLEEDEGDTQRFECSLSRPARTANYLRTLLHVRLEQIRVQAPIRAMCVRALVLEPIPDEQLNLFDADAGSESALGQLLDSLVSRLGDGAVVKAEEVADPQPELAWLPSPPVLRGRGEGESVPHKKRRAIVGRKTPSPPAPLPLSTRGEGRNAHRPLRLFNRPIAIQVIALMPYGSPQRFTNAGVDHAIIHCQGPERIETGWWRCDDIRRDYYMVETTEGTRWWIFQRVDDGHWFLHGCFD